MVNVPPFSSAASSLPLRARSATAVSSCGQLGDALLVHVADHRHQQAALGVHGDADVVIVLEDRAGCWPVSRRGVEVRELLQRHGDGLQREGRHRQLRPLAVLGLAERFQVGDVGQVVLGDVRDQAPGQAHLPGGRLAHREHRLPLDRTPFLEVGQRRRLHAGADGRRGGVRSRASWRTYALTSSSMTRPARPLPCTWLRSMPSSRASRRVAGPAGDEAVHHRDRRRAPAGLGRRARPVAVGRASPASAARGAVRRSGSRRLLRRARGGRLRRLAVAAALDETDDLADLDLIAGLDAHVGDAAGRRRRHVQRRLVGLDFQQHLVLGHRVARRQCTAFTSTVSTFSFSAGSLISMAIASSECSAECSMK